MIDISMCPDDACPARRLCRRNAASGTQPAQWQTMTGFRHEEGRGGCDSFYPVDAKAERYGIEKGLLS